MLQPRINLPTCRWHCIACVLIVHMAMSYATPKMSNDDRSHGNQVFAMEPQDQTAIVGSRVTLPCRVIGKQGTLQWTKDDFGLGTHRNLSGFERYSMVGSDEEGDFSLDIYPVMLDDDAKYQCQVGPGPQGEFPLPEMNRSAPAKDDKLKFNNRKLLVFFPRTMTGQPGIRSRFATLTILVPPEPPKILQGDFMVTTEDRDIELECISVGGKPAAEVSQSFGNIFFYMHVFRRRQRRRTAKWRQRKRQANWASVCALV